MNMKPAGFICIVFLLIGAIPVQSQSLGELGKKEKERRAKVKQDVKVLTNEDADKFKSAPITTGTSAAPSDLPNTPNTDENKGDTAPAVQAKPGQADNEPRDFKGRPEAFWRQTMADARQKVKELENQGNILTLRLSDLQTQFYREDDGFKQQAIQREIQKTFYEQDLNKQNLEAAKAQLADLQSEARKSGALPGWLQ